MNLSVTNSLLPAAAAAATGESSSKLLLQRLTQILRCSNLHVNKFKLLSNLHVNKFKLFCFYNHLPCNYDDNYDNDAELLRGAFKLDFWKKLGFCVAWVTNIRYVNNPVKKLTAHWLEDLIGGGDDDQGHPPFPLGLLLSIWRLSPCVTASNQINCRRRYSSSHIFPLLNAERYISGIVKSNMYCQVPQQVSDAHVT